MTLKEYEEFLYSEKFFSVHQSHLINLAYVEKYNKGERGSVISPVYNVQKFK